MQSPPAKRRSQKQQPQDPSQSQQQHVIRQYYLKDVDIIQISFPIDYFHTPCDPRTQTPTAVTFYASYTSGSGRSYKGVFKGKIAHIDPLHTYNIFATKANASMHHTPVYNITKIAAAKRKKLTPYTAIHAILRVGLGDYAKETACVSALRRIKTNTAFEEGCGSILRTYGATDWYKMLEHHHPVYFASWYIDLLAIPTWVSVAGSSCNSKGFAAAALRALPVKDLFAMARTAATEPWKLSFWWKNPVQTADELGIEYTKTVAKSFGVEVTDAVRRAVAAYHGDPFGTARGQGESYITMAAYASSIPDVTLRADLERMGYVYKVRPDVEVPPGTPLTAAPMHVYATGDYIGEREVVSLVMRLATQGDDRDVPMVLPVENRWPWCEQDPAPVLNEEQHAAVFGALRRRLFVCGGKPGTGKTSYVIRAINSAFPPGTVLNVAYTGNAAMRLKRMVGYCITVHKAIDIMRRGGATLAASKLCRMRVLVIEEASTISIRLLWMLLTMLAANNCGLRRIYIFGDYRQMAPVDGGSSFIAAALERYLGTPAAAELSQTMRINDRTRTYAPNLDAICGYNNGKTRTSRLACPPLKLHWTSNPLSTSAAFTFVQRGATYTDTTRIIRAALLGRGVDPDVDTSMYQIVVQTNSTRMGLGAAWYAASPIARTWPQYDDHAFSKGDRVLFCENNYGVNPQYSQFKSIPVMNGTLAIINEIFDEDLCAGTLTCTPVERTNSPRTASGCIRWLALGDPYDNALVSLDAYGVQHIIRAQPATVAKMQGLEARVIVVYLDQRSPGPMTYSRRDLYTACSRGMEACIIVDDCNMCIESPYDSSPEDDDGDAEKVPSSSKMAVCPGMEFDDIVASSSIKAAHSVFSYVFPRFEEIDNATSAVPDEYHHSQEDDEDDDTDSTGDGD